MFNDVFVKVSGCHSNIICITQITFENVKMSSNFIKDVFKSKFLSLNFLVKCYNMSLRVRVLVRIIIK